MYETLMYLVGVHAQITSVAESVLERTLNYLAETLADEALKCFKQVKKFGMGGMLRVCVFDLHVVSILNTETFFLLRRLSKLSLCTRH